MKDTNKKLNSPYAICIRLEDGRVSPIPMQVYEDDLNSEWIYQYALIYCDKITSLFKNEEQFKEYLKQKLPSEYKIKDIFLGKKEYLKDENGNKIKEGNKYKAIYKEEGFLIYNNKVISDNANAYAKKKENQKGLSNAENIPILLDNTYEIRSFIDDFLQKGYKKFLNDEYVLKTLRFRSVANLEELDNCIKNNSGKYNFVCEKLRELILSNYAVFRYIYSKSEISLEKEELLKQKEELEIQKSENLSKKTLLTMGEEELKEKALLISNAELRSFYLGAYGDSEMIVAAMGEKIKDIGASDLEVCGISEELINKVLSEINVTR